jgi:phosphatidylethanolamine/phosphatidyl-N-methylethanolamine N-methyltransferase
MDTTSLTFVDHGFDISVAMFVLTVVPDPAKVMNELSRVTELGVLVFVVDHFNAARGKPSVIKRSLAHHASKLGWRPEFPIDSVLVSDQLSLVSINNLNPMGLFTMLQIRSQ